METENAKPVVENNPLIGESEISVPEIESTASETVIPFSVSESFPELLFQIKQQNEYIKELNHITYTSLMFQFMIIMFLIISLFLKTLGDMKS